MDRYQVEKVTDRGWAPVGDPCGATTALDRAQQEAATGSEVRICNAETGAVMLKVEGQADGPPQWIINPALSHTEPVMAREPAVVVKG